MKKTCSKCKIEKEITEFYRSGRKWYRGACKRCLLEYELRRREESKANHLYKVEFPGGYYYIGSTTVGISQRTKGHFSKWDATTISRYIQKNALNREDLKYSVVKEFEDPEEMRIAERELIRKSYTDPFLLNELLPLRGDSDMEKGPKRFCTKCKIEKPIEEFNYWKCQNKYYPSCKKCLSASRKLYYEANKEELAKKSKEYYEANREEIEARRKARDTPERRKTVREWQREYRKTEKYKEYYEANKEKIAKKKKGYYEANREEKLKKNKEYYKANKEKIAKRRKEYCERKKLLDKQ